MQSLSITANHAKILAFLKAEGARCPTEIATAIPDLPAGSLGTTLTRMVAKGWVEYEVAPLDCKTPIADVTSYYLLTRLGFRALRAWHVYTGERA